MSPSSTVARQAKENQIGCPRCQFVHLRDELVEDWCQSTFSRYKDFATMLENWKSPRDTTTVPEAIGLIRYLAFDLHCEPPQGLLLHRLQAVDRLIVPGVLQRLAEYVTVPKKAYYGAALELVRPIPWSMWGALHRQLLQDHRWLGDH